MRFSFEGLGLRLQGVPYWAKVVETCKVVFF